MDYDVFISHASEDKAYAGALAEALQAAGVRVWFDQVELSWGDDLRSSIDRGLSSCRFGVVVFSRAFLGRKKWTEYEINALFARERAGQKLILPIWHGITRDDLLRYSPAFSDRLAKVSSSDSIADIVTAICALTGRKETKRLARGASPKNPYRIEGRELILAEIARLISFPHLTPYGDDFIELAEAGNIEFTDEGVTCIGGTPEPPLDSTYRALQALSHKLNYTHLRYREIWKANIGYASSSHGLEKAGLLIWSEYKILGLFKSKALGVKEGAQAAARQAVREDLKRDTPHWRTRALLSLYGPYLAEAVARDEGEQIQLELRLAALRLIESWPSGYDKAVKALEAETPPVGENTAS